MDKDYIVNSHKRCKEYGIKKSQIISNKILKNEKLIKILNEEHEFIKIAEPFMNHLYNFVKGSNFFAILTNKKGCILTMIGDEDILSEAFEYDMIPGAFMDEANIGTNAMGTALFEEVPVQISGREHYVEAYHQWTCSAAPIKDVNGEIIGCLDLTGKRGSAHLHTLGMVVAASNAIEKRVQVKDYTIKLTEAKLYNEAIVDSIPSGILTVDLKGNIKSYNAYVSKLLGFNRQELNDLNIKQVMSGFDDLVNIIKSNRTIIDEEVPIMSKRNKVLFIMSAYPIMDSQQTVSSIILILGEVKKVRKLANKIMGRRAIYTFDKVIGKSELFLNTVNFAKKISDSKSTVLIMGESGTGKEIFAQAIQNHSNRRDEPFVAINAGAIPKNLIESELFGYEEGAFTGAKRSGQPGKFEIADGGTIFLDEIGEMPLDMQTRLLRVIEESTVSRIGSANEISVDVRIIAATNKDLSEEVKNGNFRKDLFYRLNVLPIKLPSLRDRNEDIPDLMNYFMDRIARKLNKNKVAIPKDYMDYLQGYSWPGNIRELENLVELIINTETIPNYSLNINKINKITDLKVKNYLQLIPLEEVERNHIINVMKYYDGNITTVAKCLKIGRNTLYRKIERYKITCK